MRHQLDLKGFPPGSAVLERWMLLGSSISIKHRFEQLGGIRLTLLAPIIALECSEDS